MAGSDPRWRRGYALHGALFQAFRVFVADLPAAQQRALFHDNAARIYRIPGI